MSERKKETERKRKRVTLHIGKKEREGERERGRAKVGESVTRLHGPTNKKALIRHKLLWLYSFCLKKDKCQPWGVT